MFIKRFFIIILYYYFLSSLHAIDFETLHKYALENSNFLKIAKLDVDISKTQLDYISSEKYPTFSVGLSSERSKGLNSDLNDTFYVGDNSVSQSTLYKTYSYFSLTYSIFDFGRLDNKIKVQEYDIETKNEYCIKQNEISQKLLETYYKTKITQIKQKYLQKVLKYNSDLYEYYKRLNEIGNIQKMDVVSNAIQVANLYNDLNNVEINLVENLENLSNISNYTFNKNSKLDSLSVSKESTDKSFEDTNLAKKYQNEIRQKQFELEYIQAQYYPQINFFGKYDFYGFNQNNFASTLDNFEENSYKYGLNISWTIFDGFRIKAQEKKAMQELTQLKLKYQQAKKDFITQLNLLNKTHKFYSKIMQQNAKTVKLSNSNVDMALRLNSIGEIDKSIEINLLIKKLYSESEYKQAQETIAYKIMKRNIMLNKGLECIVH